MRIGFYPKLAWDSMRKNGKMYLPYLLTCQLCVCMHYILGTLQGDPVLLRTPGGESVSMVLGLGTWVIAVFSLIFLFYTNSFLIRRRKREIGLYNVLGMGKRAIAGILFFETCFAELFAVLVGMIFGMATSKLSQLILLNVVQGSTDFGFYISFKAMRNTIVLFTVIFLLLLINGIRQVRCANASELLRSEQAGDKPPKGNVLLACIGILILGIAYWLAVTIREPLTALMLFFVAVVLVIIATYMLMIVGSVTLCRILQKNKRYYYQPKHFVSISSMVYRMKRNGAGLASICILVTMVLVMISSTACMYLGAEDSLNTQYPRDFNIFVALSDMEDVPETVNKVRGTIREEIVESKHEISGYIDYRMASISGMRKGDSIIVDAREAEANPFLYENILTVRFVSLEDYNRNREFAETLQPHEVFVYAPRLKGFGESITVDNHVFAVKAVLDTFELMGDTATNAIPSLYLVISDLDKELKELKTLTYNTDSSMMEEGYYCFFDMDAGEEDQIDFIDTLRTKLCSKTGEENFPFYAGIRQQKKDDFYGTFGSFLFLGVLLSVMFIVAAVLIIYYKQLSEGFEDMERFGIMKKIGMTEQAIHNSVDSQMLTVFFFPLIMAISHLCFAFPMIQKILALFNVTNTKLLLVTSAISVTIFAVFYAIVYKVMAQIYFEIVNTHKTA